MLPLPRRARWLPVLLVLAAACARRDHAVRGSGTIEMDEVDVASLAGGRVARLVVDEGDTVRAGDTLAILDRGELSAAVQARRASAEQAAQQARAVALGPRREEVQAARAELARATAQATLAARNYTRIEQLYRSQIVAEALLDSARASRDAAAAARAAAERRWAELRNGERPQLVAAARAAARAAGAELQGAEAEAGDLVLTAPAAGVVLRRDADLGEALPAGVPVVTLGDPSRLWMRVYVAAPDLPRVHLGAPVSVRLPGQARAFEGRVVSIAPRAEFTPRAALTDEERANLVFAVKVALAPSDGVAKAGLPADAVILPPRTPPPAP